MKVINENGISNKKQLILDKLMTRVSKVYVAESIVHQEVKKGLAKMSQENLSKLSLMIQTSK